MAHFKSLSIFVFLSAIAAYVKATAIDRRDVQPIEARTSSKDVIQLGYPTVHTKGAIYFMNNDPNGNYIITAELASDGKLSYKGAFSTHGKGLHGLPLGGGDGLFSQSSVVVSRSKHLLATVNPGSNTIALFRINPMNPVELQLVSQPANSGGEFPVSVAFDSKGETLCAINSGKINGVNCYHVDDWTGLKPIPNTQRLFGLNQTTPATGPANTPSEIIFSEDGSQLIASVKGSSVDQPRFLAIWDINKDGSLSQQFKSVPAGRGGIRPFGFSTISGKNAFVVADPAIGCEIFDTSGSQATAPTSTAVNVTSQMAICWTAYSHSTGSFYLIDAGNADVVEINVDDYPKSSGKVLGALALWTAKLLQFATERLQRTISIFLELRRLPLMFFHWTDLERPLSWAHST